MIYKTLVKYRIFFTILFMAFMLRFSWLGSIPVGLSWDEAAIGYNGYGIATVHRDEWLNRMPITFKSFGDYKAAIAIYADAISTSLFGLNGFAVRFPMAVASLITVVATYAIARKMMKQEMFALIAMTAVALSPLNIHFARIGFESGIAVSLVSVGTALLLYAENTPWLYPLSGVSFVLSLYAYHSTKIAVPLLLLILGIWRFSVVKRQKSWVFLACIVSILLLFPLAKEMIYGKAVERFSMTSAISTKNGLKSPGEITGVITKNLLIHLEPAFLLFGKTDSFRHGNGVFGILSYLEFFFVITGIFSFWRKKEYRRYSWLLLCVFIGILPATLSNEVPNSNRIHGIVPWIQIIAAFGWMFWYEYCTGKKKKIFTFVSVALVLAQTIVYGYWYLQIYTTVAAKDFQYGYEEAIRYARSKEKDVEKVLLTSAYGQPYIYMVFFKRLTPIQYNQGALANYEIRDIKWDEDRNRKSLLLIGTPKEIPANVENIVKEIYYPDGSVVFRIVQF